MKTIMRMLVLVCILLFSMPVISDAAGLQTRDQIHDQTEDKTQDKLQDQDQLKDQSCLTAQEPTLLNSCDRDCTHDQLRLRDRVCVSDAAKLQVRDRIRLREQINL